MSDNREKGAGNPGIVLSTGTWNGLLNIRGSENGVNHYPRESPTNNPSNSQRGPRAITLCLEENLDFLQTPAFGLRHEEITRERDQARCCTK